MNPIQADVFFDRSELMEAMASPDYQTSARFRAEVADKLERSMAAGRVTPMGEAISHGQRSQTVNAYIPDENANGLIVPGADPVWAAAANVGAGSIFTSPEEIAAAFSAPAFEHDPTYQAAVRDMVARSIREGHITSDLKAVSPAQPSPTNT